ncbi:MAG: hypothetical protein QOJ46_53 [bacterium]
MSYESDVYEVPWNSDRWELALLERPNISFLGGPGRWVLFRPARVIVSTRALEDSRIREAVRRAGAEGCDEPDAEVAKTLGLELLLAPEGREVELVREIERLVPCSASLDHVQLPGPHRVHGDDDPVPAADPGDITGRGVAGEGLSVLVLDTGGVPRPALRLHVDPADEEIVDEDHDELRDPAAGHGTHVAGIIARLAPAADIVAHRLLKSPVGEASDLEVAAALLDHGGADIINCSFGEMTLDDVAPLCIQNALAALPASTVVVAAAGNGGVERRNWPAAFERVIAVGAVGRPKNTGDWLQTDFSNYGSWVDCCAPGVAIVSTFLTLPAEGFPSGYASWTGTSMASPAVAGTIAALATKENAGLAQAVAEVRGQTQLGTVGALVDPVALI